MDIANLIERLEKATGPDRELDRAIRTLAGGVTIPLDGSTTPASPEWQSHGGQYLPFYTSSIDAALTLVPEGWTLRALSWEHRGARAVAEVYRDADLQAANAIGETGALAVASAALRARST